MAKGREVLSRVKNASVFVKILTVFNKIATVFDKILAGLSTF